MISTGKKLQPLVKGRKPKRRGIVLDIDHSLNAANGMGKIVF